MSDIDAIQDLLRETRAAHAAATAALGKAHELAAKAGIPVTDDAVLTAERIDIVEPDGTLRLVISNKHRFPGVVIRGEETPHPDRDDKAGLLFFNDEATEDGGLVWKGQREEGGHTSAVHLSFDDFEQDQSLVLDAFDDGPDKRQQIIEFIDRPHWSYADLIRVAEEEQERFVTEQGLPIRRMRLARETDGSVGLTLRDPQGQPRIVLRVDADGTPSLRLYDAAGTIVHRIVGAS